jgi:hypothetical protein
VEGKEVEFGVSITGSCCRKRMRLVQRRAMVTMARLEMNALITARVRG